MAARAPVPAEEKANRLFREKTVAEIKSIEKQTRNDIERKKEELRQMVGERYRELIDAADTIVDMKNSSNKVLQDISHMQRQCSTLHKLHQQHSVAAISTPDDRAMVAGRLSFFSVVSQIKLLVTMPEKLWSGLEHRDYLHAARLCLMARHIMDTVSQLTASGDLRNVVKRFPILPRQWSAISHFPSLVVERCQAALQDPCLPLKNVEEALASLVLLEKSSLSHVFQEFLRARKVAVESLFSAQQQGHSFKELACRLVWLIRTTLQQVSAIFAPSSLITSSPSSSLSSPGSASSVIQLASQSVPCSDLHLGQWSKFLPESLLEFKPPPSVMSADQLAKEDIQTQCSAFMNECKAFVPALLSSSLSFVSSLESLVSVRDAVFDLLLKDTSLPAGMSDSVGVLPDTGLPAWDAVCAGVLGPSRVVLYDDFLRECVDTRMQEIICSQLSVACSAVHDSILSMLTTMTAPTTASAASTATSFPDQSDMSFSSATPSDPGVVTATWMDRNVGAYIWMDSAEDEATLQASLNVSSSSWGRDAAAAKGSNVLKSSLSIKARGVTPAAASMYSKLNADLTTLLSGVHMATGIGSKDGTGSTPVRRKTALLTVDKVEPVPFKKFATASSLCSFLRTTSFDSITSLLDKLRSELDQLRSAAQCQDRTQGSSSSSSSEHASTVDRCLLLARLVSSLLECCPLLESCLVGLQKSTTESTARSATSRRSMTTRSSSLSFKVDEGSAEQQKFLAIKDSIAKLVFDAYHVWTTSTVQTMTSALRHTILSTQPRVLLTCATAWEEIKIEEEGEEGLKVESTIRLPVQISSNLCSSLFLVCEELSRVGGHTVSTVIQQSLIREFGDALLDVFEQLLGGRSSAGGGGGVFSKRLPQSRALQCLFDVKCCATLLAGRGGKTAEVSAYNSHVRSIISWLESCIDPFDLDVFEPYLASNLSRCVQRCASLYGGIYSHAKTTGSNFVGGASALAAAASTSLTSGKAGRQEHHNVIPMATNINRLPLLPIGTGMVSTATQDGGSDRSAAATSAMMDRPPSPAVAGGFANQMVDLSSRIQLFSLDAGGSSLQS